MSQQPPEPGEFIISINKQLAEEAYKIADREFVRPTELERIMIWNAMIRGALVALKELTRREKEANATSTTQQTLERRQR